MNEVKLPVSGDLLFALLQVLDASSTPLKLVDIESRVARTLGVTEEQLKIMRSEHRSEFSYRLAWERTHAKNKGFAARSSHATWEITDLGRKFILNE